MSFGLKTFSSSGDPISDFSEDYMRFVLSVRMEALATGSLQLQGDYERMRYFFQADNPVQTTAPVISISSTGLLSWRPYATSPGFHTSGYIIIGIVAQ